MTKYRKAQTIIKYKDKRPKTYPKCLYFKAPDPTYPSKKNDHFFFGGGLCHQIFVFNFGDTVLIQNMTLGRKVGHKKRKKKWRFFFPFYISQIKYTFEKSDFLIIKCKDYDRLYQIKRNFFFCQNSGVRPTFRPSVTYY